MADEKQRGDPAYLEFRLQDSPFFLVSRVSGRYVQDMEMVLKAIGMDMPGWRALMIIRERNPSSVSEIADLAVTRLSTMTRVVQRLQAQRLVRLEARPTDARKTDVYLTPKGRDRVHKVRTAASRVYETAVRGIAAGEIRDFNAVLRRMFDNLAVTGSLTSARRRRRRRKSNAD